VPPIFMFPTTTTGTFILIVLQKPILYAHPLIKIIR